LLHLSIENLSLRARILYIYVNFGIFSSPWVAKAFDKKFDFSTKFYFYQCFYHLKKPEINYLKAEFIDIVEKEKNEVSTINAMTCMGVRSYKFNIDIPGH
jgi:hypothetical protein